MGMHICTAVMYHPVWYQDTSAYVFPSLSALRTLQLGAADE